jgi:beta-N-acetylhexosaminidase
MRGTRKAPARKVRTGLEILIDREADKLKGPGIGVLAHAASVTSSLRYAWDALGDMSDLRLKALFSPEHGLMGTHQDQEGVEKQRHEWRAGVPVFSLYGHDAASLRPTGEMLEGLDLLLVDLQDVGSRYYTYVYTLSYCMEACREAGVEVWVLDRPNPIGGTALEGNLVSREFRSFVGRYPLPARHGMTIGELAWMMNEAFEIGCSLRIVAMEGWKRGVWFDQTGLPWVLPSPNMPTLGTATVYPGGCLLEGTNLSEGRGTTRPFEIVGAPWVDPAGFADVLNALDLPGVRFRPLSFRPTFHKYAGQTCGGIEIHVVDREAFLPYLTGIQLIFSAARLWPDAFDWRREPYEFESERLAIDLLAGGTWFRELVEEGEDPSGVSEEWKNALEEFENLRNKYLLY